MNRPRAFVAVFLALPLLATTAMVAISIVVDPFWRFDLINIPGFNAQKTQFHFRVRMSKAGVVCREQPKAAILGTSRVEVGMDPTHPALHEASGPAYNLAMDGSGLHELDLTLRHAVHSSPRLKRALLGLDFLMFNAYREAVVFETEVFDFDQRRLVLSPDDNCWRSIAYDANDLLGPKGLLFSIGTVVTQMAEPTSPTSAKVLDWINNYDRNGFRSNFEILQKTWIQNRGYRGLFGDSQERYYIKHVWRPPPEQRYCFVRDGQPNAFDTFRRMLDFARASGIDLRIFINPVHARLLLAIRDGGLWPQYEEWKKGIVGALAAEAAASGKPQFQLWDFSGFNNVTTESVPPAGDTTTIMKGFWEPSHYKKEIGDLMIDRMLDYADPARSVPPDFGVPLTPATIDAWIAETRVQMHDYMQNEPAEAALVELAADDVLDGSDGSNCGYDVAALREASAARKRGETTAADAAIARAVTLHEADRRSYAELDVPYRETGFDRMLAEVKAGVELESPLPTWQAYQERGIARSDAGDYVGAANDFASAVRIGPEKTVLHFLRGVALLRAGNAVGAAGEFERGLKLEPTNPALAQSLQQARSAHKAN